MVRNPLYNDFSGSLKIKIKRVGNKLLTLRLKKNSTLSSVLLFHKHTIIRMYI
ncbi:MAG: hypothetical protein IKX14_06320 [Neisseriaceae bacterium]|nr:hypothetical protein [Neisseriaceae bacterium]